MSPHPLDPECEIDDTLPGNLAVQVRSWLGKNSVSVDLFAKEILHRSQGTVSSLLNNPPTAFPAGTGREPWEKMKHFLTDPTQQESLLSSRKGE